MTLTYNIFFLLTEFSSYSIFIPLFVGIAHYKRLNFANRLLFYYILVATIVEFFSAMLSRRGINNLFLLHLFTAFEFIALTFYFQTILKENGIKFNSILYCIAFLLFVGLNFTFFEDLNTFNTNARIVESLWLIFLAGIHLYYLSNSLNILYITELPAFWGSSAILLYFAGSLFIFAYSSLFIANWVEFYPAIWTIHSFFNIVFNILIAKAIWSKPKP